MFRQIWFYLRLGYIITAFYRAVFTLCLLPKGRLTESIRSDVFGGFIKPLEQFLSSTKLSKKTNILRLLTERSPTLLTDSKVE